MESWHWERPGDRHRNPLVWLPVALVVWGAVGLVVWAVTRG